MNGDSVVPHLNKTCKDEINEDPNRCEVESNKDRCCASCAGKRKRNGGDIEKFINLFIYLFVQWSRDRGFLK